MHQQLPQNSGGIASGRELEADLQPDIDDLHFVSEPGGAISLGSGVGMLLLLARRRERAR